MFEEELEENYIKEIAYIKAQKDIEDWMLWEQLQKEPVIKIGNREASEVIKELENDRIQQILRT